MINDNLTASERLKYFKFSSSWELLSPDNAVSYTHLTLPTNREV